MTGVERDDFILPKWRLPTNKIPFKHVKFKIAKGIYSHKKRDNNIEKISKINF